MSDIMDLLQRMMQSNMSLPNLKQIPVPGVKVPGVPMDSASEDNSASTLFDTIKRYQAAHKDGAGKYPGGNSLFKPVVDDNGTPTEGATTADGVPVDASALFQPKMLSPVSLQRPTPFSGGHSGKGGAQ